VADRGVLFVLRDTDAQVAFDHPTEVVVEAAREHIFETPRTASKTARTLCPSSS